MPDAGVDQARFAAALQRYAKLPAVMHVQGLDAVLPKPEETAALYKKTQMGETAYRLSWMGKAAGAEFTKSEDAFIALADKVMGPELDLEKRRKDLDGKLEIVVDRDAGFDQWLSRLEAEIRGVWPVSPPDLVR